MIPVGLRLQQERQRRGYSVDEVAKATKIRSKFLIALEKGDYKKLPSSAYIQGFIKNYAEFLELPQRETLALFRREFDEREFIGVLPESFANPNKPALSGLRFHSTTLLIIAGLIFLGAFIFFEYRSAFLSPDLTISFPAENAKIGTQLVTVTGKSDPNTTVTINDIPVFLDKDGKFKKEIPVFTGSNDITIKAVNKFGKKAMIVRHITVH